MRTRFAFSAATFTVVALSLPLSAAQAGTQQPPPPAAASVIRTDVDNVLVDVVVKDRRGRPFRGLKPKDVTLTENGTPQKILSFREVRSAGAARADLEPTVQNGQSGAIAVNRQIRLVSLVFERLGSQSRSIARQAALEFLANDLGANVYYAVFYIDRTFLPVSGYTNDKVRLREAIERATAGNPSGLSSDSRRTARIAEPSVSDASQRQAPPRDFFDDTLSAMEKFNDRMDRQLFGRIALFSLWGIVDELGRLPGRKSVLLFSEGLTLPDLVLQQYESLIAAANRANVSVHTIDARGLTVSSDQVLANRLMGDAIRGSRATLEGDPVPQFSGKLAVDIIPVQMLSLDNALDSVHANGQMNLSDLAERTGGMAIYNTNDFRKPLRELSEEFNTYYEISYSPTDRSYDGRFRTIDVKVAAKGASVQARKGYFALPPMKGDTVFPYEVPLLNALGKSTLPRDVDYRSGVIQFGDKAGLRQASLVFDVLLKDVVFTPDDKTGQARSHLSVLALVKDETGRVVAKLSRDVPLNHPRERVEGFRRGHFIVTRPIELPPGRYTLESVAADQEATRFGARRSVIVISPKAAGPYLSELSLVRRLDSIKGELEQGDLLVMNGDHVVPTLTDVVPAGAARQVAAFLLAYPDAGADSKPQLAFEILRDGQVLNRGVPPLPPPNEAGAYPYLVNLGLGDLPAGQYEFRASLTQGIKQIRRSLFFTIGGA